MADRHPLRQDAGRKLLLSKRCFIFDLDGVVWAGDHALPGAVDTLAALQALGKRLAFVTNNSARMPWKLHQNLTRLGVVCRLEEIMTSGQATAQFIAERKMGGARGVFVVGTDDLREMLRQEGVQITEPDTCGALVVGYDPEFTYLTIVRGLVALSRGVPFVVCNREANYPGDGRKLLPGCGAMVGAIVGASLRDPDIEIGKPNTLMLDLLLNRLEIRAEESIYFGDTLESDVKMAKAAGVSGVWISGASGIRKGVGLAAEPIRPELQLSCLAEVVELIR